MRLEIVFTNADFEEKSTVKRAFVDRGIVCIKEKNSELEFEDSGRKIDFGEMWAVTLALTELDWFVDGISKLMWFDEDGQEDILAQVLQERINA